MFSILFDHEETFFLLCNKKMRFLISFLFFTCTSFAQSTTIYFSGTTLNKDTLAVGGIGLMVGATKYDNAMEWFMNRANGGDFNRF